MSQIVTTEAIQQIVMELSDKEITPARLSKAFFNISRMKKAIENLYDISREKTLEFLKEHGERFGSGSLRAEINGLKLEAITTGSGYDDKRVEALLRTKGLDPTAGMDATVTYKVNVEKLARVLSDGELSACKKEQGYRVNSPKPVNDSEE